MILPLGFKATPSSLHCITNRNTLYDVFGMLWSLSFATCCSKYQVLIGCTVSLLHTARDQCAGRFDTQILVESCFHPTNQIAQDKLCTLKSFAHQRNIEESSHHTCYVHKLAALGTMLVMLCAVTQSFLVEVVCVSVSSVSDLSFTNWKLGDITLACQATHRTCWCP